MLIRLPERISYSRGERLSDALIHGLGILFALAGVPVLIAMAIAWRGDLPAVGGITVYGLCLIAMLVFSALCNLITNERFYRVFRRLDHSAIYLKIAGTYTPFTLLSTTGAGYLLAGLWTAALAGAGMKLTGVERVKWPGLVLYLAMGWAGVFFGWHVFAEVSGPVFMLIAGGGLIYTFGVIFYLWERLPYHNTIWHAMVLVASGMFYAAITLHLSDRSFIA